MKKNNQSFEGCMIRLEEISSLLEDNNIPLEEALTLYEEGINLSKECLSILKNAELKVTELKGKINLPGAKADLFEE